MTELTQSASHIAAASQAFSRDVRPGINVSAEASPKLRADALAVEDRPLTFRAAANELGVAYYIVQRAARKGLVPTYGLGTSRRYVKLRDFIEMMKR